VKDAPTEFGVIVYTKVAADGLFRKLTVNAGVFVAVADAFLIGTTAVYLKATDLAPDADIILLPILLALKVFFL